MYNATPLDKVKGITLKVTICETISVAGDLMILELIVVRVWCIVWLFVWVYVVNWFFVWAVRALMVSVVLAGLPVWCRHLSEGRANQHYGYWAYQRSGNWANQWLTQAARITLYKFLIYGTVFSSL